MVDCRRTAIRRSKIRPLIFVHQLILELIYVLDSNQIYGNVGIRVFWVPLFERYDVDSVFRALPLLSTGRTKWIQCRSPVVVGLRCFSNSLTFGVVHSTGLPVYADDSRRGRASMETYDLEENLIDSGRLVDRVLLWLPLFQDPRSCHKCISYSGLTSSL